MLIEMVIGMTMNLGAVDPVEDYRVMDLTDFTSKRQ